jgi:sugar-specific transcriptional regulator TrmB
MTTMEAYDLIRLGFNKNEAKVYLSLIKFGKADAGMIIRETKFHKNIVYDNLEKLMNKGLAGFIIEDKRKVFSITSSNSLVEFFDGKEKEIAEKKKLAQDFSKEIEKRISILPKKQEAIVFKGVSGIKTFYNETLKGEDYVVFGAPQESLNIMGELFWKNYNLKREENNIKVKMIFNPSIKAYGDSITDKYTEVKYFERDFEPLTETNIQGNKVGIIVWTEEPVIFVIEEEAVAKSYLAFFEKMWKQAKVASYHKV